MDSLLRQKLTQLTSKCEVLQKNGKYNQCIDIMQQIVTIKKNIYGLDHIEFQKASEKLCQYLNLAAMVQLHKQNFQQTLDSLRKAELVAGQSINLKATTYNNLACYYRRTGKVRTALSYLIQALELQLKLENPKTLSDTHLNLCAVLSQLDRHQDALQHSMLSIILLQDQFLKVLMPKNQNGELIDDERLAVLAIAYHNMGVEFEHLKRFDEALKIYKKALNFSKENLSANVQLVKNLTKVVNSATEQIQEQKRNLTDLSSKAKFLQSQVQGSQQQTDPKKDFYKDLSKKVDRYRHLPKINKYNPMGSSHHRQLSSNLAKEKSTERFHSIDFGSRTRFEHSDEFINVGASGGGNGNGLGMTIGMNPNKTVNKSKNPQLSNYGGGGHNERRYFGQKYSSKLTDAYGGGNVVTPESRAQLDSELKFRSGTGGGVTVSGATNPNRTYMTAASHEKKDVSQNVNFSINTATGGSKNNANLNTMRNEEMAREEEPPGNSDNMSEERAIVEKR